MRETHHIGLTNEFAHDVDFWLVSGEPRRTEDIYEMLDVKAGKITTGRCLPVAKGLLNNKISKVY